MLLICISLMISDIGHFLICLSVSHLYVLFGEVSVLVLCPFFNWIVCLLGVDLYTFFIYFGNQALILSIMEKSVPEACMVLQTNVTPINSIKKEYLEESL